MKVKFLLFLLLLLIVSGCKKVVNITDIDFLIEYNDLCGIELGVELIVEEKEEKG